MRGSVSGSRTKRDSKAMSFLDPPRCENCNSLVDLTELWQAAPRSGNAIIDRVAIACPVCGVKLRVLQSRAYVTGLLAFIVPCAMMVVAIFLAPVTRGSMDYKIRMAIFAVVLVSAVVLHKRSIPRLLTVRLLRENEIARFPLARSTTPAPDPEAAPNALDLEPIEDERPSWNCPKCGEENPGNFNECWKCQTARSISRSAPP